MFNISESQKKVLIAWAIIGVVILALVTIVAINTVQNKSTKEEEGLTAPNSKKIIDRSRYYTVKNAITKYYSYINMGDYESVLTILENNYVKDNNIDVSNVKNFLTDTKMQISYDSRIMCLKSFNDGAYTFVIDGDEISANTGVLINKKHYEITLDGNNSTYSLKPIEENIYNEVCNG